MRHTALVTIFILHCNCSQAAEPSVLLAVYDAMRAASASAYCNFSVNKLAVREHLRRGGLDPTNSEHVGYLASISSAEGKKWKALSEDHTAHGNRLAAACRSVMDDLGAGKGLVSPK